MNIAMWARQVKIIRQSLAVEAGLVELKVDAVDDIASHLSSRDSSRSNILEHVTDYKPSDAWSSGVANKGSGYPYHENTYDAIKFHFFNSSVKIVLITVFISVSAQTNASIFNAGYLIIASGFLFYADELVARGTKIFFVLIIYNWMVFLLQLTFQAPWFPPLQQCFLHNTPAMAPLKGKHDLSQTSDSTSDCFTWEGLIGFVKFVGSNQSDTQVHSLSFSAGLGPSLVIFILSIIQLRVYHSPAYSYVKDFYIREGIHSKARAVENTRILARERLDYWLVTQNLEKEAAYRLFTLAERAKQWQSQQWIRDDASHYAPRAPEIPPTVSDVNCTSVKLSWPSSLVAQYNDTVGTRPIVGFKIQYQINRRTSMFGNWSSICIGHPNSVSYVVRK